MPCHTIKGSPFSSTTLDTSLLRRLIKSVEYCKADSNTDPLFTGNPNILLMTSTTLLHIDLEVLLYVILFNTSWNPGLVNTSDINSSISRSF